MSAEFLAAAEIETAFPMAWAKLAALGPFKGPHLACRHVVDGQAGLVCVQHPGAGLNCVDCIEGHINRHDPAGEMTCDECNLVVGAIHGVAIECKPRPMALFDTRGRSVRRCLPIYILGLGICAPCGTARRAAA